MRWLPLVLVAAGCLNLDALRVGPDGPIADLASPISTDLSGELGACASQVAAGGTIEIGAGAPCGGVIDTYIGGDAPDQSHGLEPTLSATSSTVGPPLQRVILLRFDLSALHQLGKSINTAKLRLGVISDSPQALIRDVGATAWGETSTWNEPTSGTSWTLNGCPAGPYLCGAVLVDKGQIVTTVASPNSATIDVTTAARMWLEQPTLHNGVFIGFDNTANGNTLTLHSSQATTAQDRPVLLLELL